MVPGTETSGLQLASGTHMQTHASWTQDAALAFLPSAQDRSFQNGMRKGNQVTIKEANGSRQPSPEKTQQCWLGWEHKSKKVAI